MQRIRYQRRDRATRLGLLAALGGLLLAALEAYLQYGQSPDKLASSSAIFQIAVIASLALVTALGATAPRSAVRTGLLTAAAAGFLVDGCLNWALSPALLAAAVLAGIAASHARSD